MERVMSIIRKTLGVLFAIFGTYYCILSVVTLGNLSNVTAQWVRRSGDPDFKYDFEMFMGWIAMGAVVVGAFGCRTAAKGVMAARGRRESWLALAIGAPLLHWFWFLYRTIGNGLLDPVARARAGRNDGIWFGGVCLAYAAMCFLMRQRASGKSPLNATVEPTGATGR